MIDLEALNIQISDIMHRFPSFTADVWRPQFDEYGQPTDTWQGLGQAELWWRTPDQGDRLGIDDKGRTYSDDGPRWACALIADAPQVRRDDRVSAGGKTWYVGNVQTRLARVFWQLVPESSLE